jgi:hypothetical protein
MSITGLVPTGSEEPSLTIHKDAILRNEMGEFVFFDAGGVAAMAQIRSLFPVGDRMAIEAEALQAGAKVVTQGNERMFPGQPLIPAAAIPGGAGEAPAAPGAGRPGQTTGQNTSTSQGR